MIIFVLTGCGKKAVKTVEQPKQIEKQETKIDVLPIIDFEGKVTPSVLTKGYDATITVNVTNKGTEDIKGIRLLFSNQELVTKGLIIKNVVNGEIRLSIRSFEWPNIIIKPNETAELKIEAQAGEPGQYNNIITIQPIGKADIYKTSNGDAELNYTFNILE